VEENDGTEAAPAIRAPHMRYGFQSACSGRRIGEFQHAASGKFLFINFDSLS
jgi:hypothetical protein